jgi:hypothetical protein
MVDLRSLGKTTLQHAIAPTERDDLINPVGHTRGTTTLIPGGKHAPY